MTEQSAIVLDCRASIFGVVRIRYMSASIPVTIELQKEWEVTGAVSIQRQTGKTALIVILRITVNDF